jgi:hypothetical protein
LLLQQKTLSVEELFRDGRRELVLVLRVGFSFILREKFDERTFGSLPFGDEPEAVLCFEPAALVELVDSAVYVHCLHLSIPADQDSVGALLGHNKI